MDPEQALLEPQQKACMRALARVGAESSRPAPRVAASNLEGPIRRRDQVSHGRRNSHGQDHDSAPSASAS